MSSQVEGFGVGSAFADAILNIPDKSRLVLTKTDEFTHVLSHSPAGFHYTFGFL
jgi:hypothetical protein